MEKSLNEDTYEKLKYDIMNFKLVPGDSISAQKIAVRYNVVCCDKRNADKADCKVSDSARNGFFWYGHDHGNRTDYA